MHPALVMWPDSCYGVERSWLTVTAPIFDVKFYPYAAPGVDPIFAATGGTGVNSPRNPQLTD